MNKELRDMTFDEMAQYCQGKIVLAIPVGKFNQAVWDTCDIAIQWRVLQESKRKESEKK